MVKGLGLLVKWLRAWISRALGFFSVKAWAWNLTQFPWMGGPWSRCIMEELQAGCTKGLQKGSRGTYIYIYICIERERERERERYVDSCWHSTPTASYGNRVVPQ